MDQPDLSALRERIGGTLVLDGDPGFDDARRIWNGMIDRRPVAVLRVASVDDVVAALAFAREASLSVAVRGGGHNVAGNGSVDAGLVIDLGGLASVEVDAGERTVRVGGGARLGDVDRATAEYGLAVPLGVVSRTGVAGLTLGGGVGWLLRAHGLSIDSLLSADVVTASGTLVRASARENPDLFWGLRGGGGNFGVVTSLTFRAHPIPAPVFAGNLIYRPDHWRQALLAFDEWGRTLPDELTAIATFIVPPPDWELGADPLLLVGFAWSGADAAAGEAAIEPLRREAPPDLEAIEPMTWPQWQSAVDDTFPFGVRAYWKNTSFDRLDEEVADVLVRRALEQTWQGTGFDIHLMGGAFARVPEGDTAFPARSARYWLNIYGFWANESDDADRIRFVRGFADDMAGFSSGGQYVNFMAAEDPAPAGVAPAPVYGEETLRRLGAVKASWDPDNVFRLNHNILPG
ncbi:FAD-binding oxidoreductase [Mycetocola sp. 2940]|uniref:FAD-binding oxidoreductase n=1 Tax=Mycetocola sp. 2940 TaxID=3156452 RepID=UPI00339B9942